MMKNSSILQMVIRGTGLIQLILGVMVWAGKLESLVLLHIMIGSILTIALFILIYQAIRAGVSRGFVIMAVVWTLMLPILGLTQTNILPQAFMWIAQLVHVLLGLGAIGIGEMLAVRMRKAKA